MQAAWEDDRVRWEQTRRAIEADKQEAVLARDSALAEQQKMRLEWRQIIAKLKKM